MAVMGDDEVGALIFLCGMLLVLCAAFAVSWKMGLVTLGAAVCWLGWRVANS